MIDIPARRTKCIVSPWGTVSIGDIVFAVPKEYIGQEVYLTISARIELAEQVDAFKKNISAAIEFGMTFEDLAKATDTRCRCTIADLVTKKEDSL